MRERERHRPADVHNAAPELRAFRAGPSGQTIELTPVGEISAVEDLRQNLVAFQDEPFAVPERLGSESGRLTHGSFPPDEKAAPPGFAPKSVRGRTDGSNRSRGPSAPCSSGARSPKHRPVGLPRAARPLRRGRTRRWAEDTARRATAGRPALPPLPGARGAPRCRGSPAW